MNLGPKILVVEDEPDIMRIITHALTAAGYRVVHAYGGEDAIRKVKSQRPDLVLTDLAMPKVSGVEVIQAIKKDPETQHIPILAVTAHVWDGIAQSAGQVGVNGFIPKPFNMKQLLLEVQKYLPSPN
ncbi:MAG: response regulator [Deltaproteobacteria bacterium]|nr:response regulator [Deltaproteobacteria bacterium]MBI3388330.1 response regulator [Deltaproteobacteria bacterium]